MVKTSSSISVIHQEVVVNETRPLVSLTASSTIVSSPLKLKVSILDCKFQDDRRTNFFAGPAAVSVNHGDAAIIVESASTSNTKDKPRAKEDHSFQVGSQSNVETVEVRSEQPSSLVVDHHDGVQVWLGHDDSESESQLADHPAAVAQAATAPTVRVESESEQDLDLMEFINWPEDQI